MEIVVRAKNTKVEPRVQKIAREKLAKLARFGIEITRVEVDFSEIRNPRVARHASSARSRCTSSGHFVKAHAASTDQLAALDLVIDKVEHQVTRLKERKVDRTHQPRRRNASRRRRRSRTGTEPARRPTRTATGDRRPRARSSGPSSSPRSR